MLRFALDARMAHPPDDLARRGPLGLVRGKGGRPSTKRLDYLTRALVLKLRAAEPDRSIRDIAEVVGVSEASARRILQAHTSDVKGLTRELLVSGVLDRLDEWAKASSVASAKGFHHPAKEWLEAAEVVERKPQAPAVAVDARPTITVNIPFAIGGVTPAFHAAQVRALPGPAVDVATPDTPTQAD